MANGKDSLETLINLEVSTGSTASLSSTVKVGEKQPEPTISIIGRVRKAAAKIPKTKKELSDFMRSAQKAIILKTLAAVLLAVFMVWLLNGMYVQHQTTNSLAQTTSYLVQEVDAQREILVSLLGKDSKSNTTIQLRDVRKFLDSDGKEKLGESFHCIGLSWHLYFEKLGDGLRVLVCHGISHDVSNVFGMYRHYSVNATFDLTMVNHDDKEKSKTRHFSQMFEKSAQHHCWGDVFASISDLYRGFVKEDAIDFKLKFSDLHVNLFE